MSFEPQDAAVTIPNQILPTHSYSSHIQEVYNDIASTTLETSVDNRAYPNHEEVQNMGTPKSWSDTTYRYSASSNLASVGTSYTFKSFFDGLVTWIKSLISYIINLIK